MNNILLDNWNGYNFGQDLSVLAGNVLYQNESDCYFFLKKELGVTADTWNAAKAAGQIRHCKPYRGQFMDYVVKKNFDTLEEWAADAGGSLNDVLYGTNRVRCFDCQYNAVTDTHYQVPSTPKYVELSVLLRHLGYVAPTVVVPEFQDIDVDDITKKMGQLMAERDLSINNVWVISNGSPRQWTSFIKE